MWFMLKMHFVLYFGVIAFFHLIRNEKKLTGNIKEKNANKRPSSLPFYLATNLKKDNF